MFTDGVIPWISVGEAQQQISRLINRNQIVIPHQSAILLIDYPLNKPVEIPIKSTSANGFTKEDLAIIVSREYKRIYQEEEATANIKTTPMEQRKGLINRNQTDGKYGIWGHDIEDLDLSGISVIKDEKGQIYIELMIES